MTLFICSIAASDYCQHREYNICKDPKMWDLAKDVHDSLGELGILDIAKLSLDESN